VNEPFGVGAAHRDTRDAVIATRENLGIEIRDIRMIENDPGGLAFGCEPSIGARRVRAYRTEQHAGLVAGLRLTTSDIPRRGRDAADDPQCRGRSQGRQTWDHSSSIGDQRALLIARDDHREWVDVG
jgi:hypothetical protein